MITLYPTFCPHCKKMISLNEGGDGELTKDLHHYIRAHNVRNGKGLASHHIFLWLRSRAPAHSHQELIDLMLKAGMVRSESNADGTALTYWAKDHDRGD